MGRGVPAGHQPNRRIRTSHGPAHIATQGVSFSPVQLFMDADWVVKAVIIGLALASIWAWMIIVSFMLKISRINRESDRFERDFWKSSDIDGFFGSHGKSELPVARVFAAGVAEWRRSTNGKSIDRAGTRERLATAMDASNCGGNRQARQPFEFPRDDRIGCALCRAVRHRLGHHAQLSPRLPPSRILALPSSHPALPRRCSPPPSACSRRSRRSSPTTASRTG